MSLTQFEPNMPSVVILSVVTPFFWAALGSTGQHWAALGSIDLWGQSYKKFRGRNLRIFGIS